MFSISVPIKTNTTHLQLTLESIKAQSDSVELAVLNASEDPNINKLVNKYKSIIAYDYHHLDDGQSDAIQRGWDHTAGEIISWLNADDHLFPGALEKVKSVFDLNPDIDVVYGHAVQVYDNGAFQMYFPSITEKIEELRSSNIICQPSCFVRRKAMEKVGGLDLTLQYTMDWDFWLRLLNAGCKFQFLNEPLSVVRVHPKTKTLTGGLSRYREIYKILCRENGGGVHLKSIIGHLYGDALNRGSIRVQQLLRGGMLAGQLFQRNGSSQNLSSIMGLERINNQCSNECTVAMTWFSQNLPEEVELVVDCKAAYSLIQEGKAQPFTLVGSQRTTVLGKQGQGFIYKVNIDSLNKQEIVLKIMASGNPWRLLSLQVR